jgi:hypothetical protein
MHWIRRVFHYPAWSQRLKDKLRPMVIKLQNSRKIHIQDTSLYIPSLKTSLPLPFAQSTKSATSVLIQQLSNVRPTVLLLDAQLLLTLTLTRSCV